MTYQHQEFQTRLRDAERLQLYAQSVVSDHMVLSASLVEAELSSQRWENEARGSVERIAQAEVERDAARHDALMACMDADTVGSSRAKVESELARVQNALAVTKEARRKADDEVSRLTDERVSLLLELGTCKDEMFAIQAEALRENEALREAYEERFGVIFNYGYGCCAFAHNICGIQPKVPDGMSDTSKSLSPEFFTNPRCPPGAIPVAATSIDVHPDEVMNAPEREASATFLETENSNTDEHLSVAEVGSGKEPAFSE